MRLKPAAVILIVALSGCAFKVTTPEVAVNAPPPQAPALSIGAVASGIDVSGAEQSNDYFNFRNDFYATLMTESRGVITPYTRQELHLYAAIHSQYDDLGLGSAFWDTLTMFIPPLGLIAVTSSEKYTVTYSIRDRDDRVVYSRTLKGAVGGYIKGWYLGQINAYENLLDAEGPFIAKNAARLVLQDVFENAAVISHDAAHILSGKAGAAPAAPRPGEH